MENNNITSENEVKKKLEDFNFNVFIKNKNTMSWWDDIGIEKDGKWFRIIGCNLDVIINYEITQLIQSYHSFVDYYNMLVTTVNHKPLNMAYLKVVNFEDILIDIEKIEKDIKIFRIKIQKLELELKERILDYITSKDIILEERTLTKSLFAVFTTMFKWKKNDSNSHAIQVSVTNNLVRYQA